MSLRPPAPTPSHFDRMNAVPCPLCGYDAPEANCPHCNLEATAESLRNRPRNPTEAIFDGFRAVPQGALLILKTRGVKRILVPPVLITGTIFLAILWWMLSFILGFAEAAVAQDPSALEIEAEWLRRIAEWLITTRIVVWAAKAGSLLLTLVTGFFLMWWVGSIVYEAVAGPFLDEVQGRIEKTWFGKNPRDEIQRPTDLPVSKCIQYSVIGGVPALLFLTIWLVTAGPVAWFFFLISPIPFFALGLFFPDYGSWLVWVMKVEGRTLLVSIKASVLAALFFIPALVLKFVPVIGPLLFAVVVGFATALTLLDIPFSRRQWPLYLRVRFIFANILPMIAYGTVAGLLFAIPLLGPMLMVPSASIGGLWLVCRLDKTPLRTEVAPPRTGAGSPAG